jgi:integrase
MRTITVSLSKLVIKQYENDRQVYQLHDLKYPLYYRFSTVDRMVGTFYFVLYKNSKDHWLKLGRFPVLSVKAATDKLKALQREIEQREVISAQLSFTDVNELLRWYIDRVERNDALSEYTIKNQRIIVNKHLLPYFNGIAVDELTLAKADQVLFQPLQKNLALSTLDNVLSTLSGALKRATALKLITVNPLPTLSLALFTNQRPVIKVGRLTQLDLLRLLKQLPSVTVTQQCLVMLLLLHGTRVGETVQAKWEHFDFKAKLWRLPSSTTKNKKEHTLPLSDVAITWLKHYKKAQRLTKRSTYLFPQKRNFRKPISGSQGSTMMLGISKGAWSAHDIRKFARTWWMENGIDYMVGELLLNHTLNKLDKTYIQTLALSKCRDALEQWSAWLVKQGLNSQQTKPRYNPDRRKWKVN